VLIDLIVLLAHAAQQRYLATMSAFPWLATTMTRLIVIFLLCAVTALAGAAESPASVRDVRLLSDGWRFAKGEQAGAEQANYDDSAWRRVAVPHDYSIEGPIAQNNPSGPAGGFFPGGVAWYRTTLDLPRPAAGRRTFVVFDGVMANSTVWINGKEIARHPSGYTSFVAEVSRYLKPGANILAVRCDNAREPSLRWYLGGGIYRQVRLVSTNSTMLAPWSSFVSTPKVYADKAEVEVRSTANAPDGGRLALRVQLRDPQGRPLGVAATAPATVGRGGHVDLVARLQLGHPQRWDIGNGVLYNAEITLLRDGRAVDAETVPFGVRTAEFRSAEGFVLNGRPVKILGVALHADGGALGTAVPLAVWQRRLLALRALGVNAIRTAHHAVAPEFLDLCDRLGLLVMDEFFDQWTLPKVPYDYSLVFKDWAERDAGDMVRRDRNHPSIVIYSAGNEIRDTTRPDVAKEWLARLMKVYHENDPGRPVTQALFRPNTSHDYDNGYADMLDVVGQNYREQEILAAYRQKPTRKIIGTENTHEVNQWVALRDHPAYAGQFLWTGIDYLGEAGRWPTIGTGSGLLRTTGLPRPRAFERQSWWTEAPMVRMARRVATVAQGIVEPVFGPGGEIAQPAAVKPRFLEPLAADWSPVERGAHDETLEIFTNAEEVELRLNGVLVGTYARHADATPIVVKVPFMPGILSATARRGGVEVASDRLRTAGAPARLALVLDGPAGSISRQVDDIATVTVTLVDADGVRIPDNMTPVRFEVEGEGKLVAVDNGNLLDHDAFQVDRRRLYDGNAVAYLRATAQGGSIRLRAIVDGLPPALMTVPVQPAAPLVPLHGF
jgi:beta-galactosidase